MATSAPRPSAAAQRAIVLFKKHAGLLRMADALRAGVSRATLQTLLESGTLERLSRGLYRLTEAEPLSNPDLAVVAAKAPAGRRLPDFRAVVP